MNLQTLRIVAVAALLALIALSLMWELWLAPLRPGGSWLVLKALPLLLPLRGLLHGRRYTYQWVSLGVWLYFIEGTVRGSSDYGLSAILGWVEAALCVILFAACCAYARLSAPSRMHASR
ncbi:DUF2069 domain-containing protein [Uliginosibacterium sp. sgz301328]|uniref:DUF2069 domain-containing protein n=1 Tax=Uliginosibacterium sp. sgz301328 TaxID=3243764 RepID=UPI00359E87FD